MTSRILLLRKGFTLVELVVVITVLGIIIAAGTLSYSSSIQQANDEKIKSNIESIRISLELYKRNKAADSQYYPLNLDTVSSAGYDVPVHPITKDLVEYNYVGQPENCSICTSYKMEAEIDGGNSILYATPLEVRILEAEEPTMTPVPTLAPTRAPTPTTAVWSTPIPIVPTSTPIPRPTLSEYNCASCTSWSQFSLACGAAVGCPAGQSSFVCVGHITCVECRIPDVSCATSVTVAPTIKVGPTSGFGNETM